MIASPRYGTTAVAEQRRADEAEAEDHLEEKIKAAAPLAAGEFIDISVGNRHLAAKADALDKADRCSDWLPGKGAGDAHHAIDRDRDGDRASRPKLSAAQPAKSAPINWPKKAEDITRPICCGDIFHGPANAGNA